LNNNTTCGILILSLYGMALLKQYLQPK